MADQDKLLGPREVGDVIGVSEKFVYRHARELGAIRVGSLLKFRRSDIDLYLEKRKLSGRVPVREEARPMRGP